MPRFFRKSMLLGVILVATGSSAHAQYGYGWGGWGGGSSLAGSAASGRGVYAAGAGMYNEQTAEARSINSQTAMQWNDYMYQINQRNSANEVARLNRRQQEVKETQAATYQRLQNNPDSRDIRTGDALNVVLTEIVNPRVYTQVIQKSTQPVDSALVRTIPFEYAAKMIVISLDDLSAAGVPDVLLTTPAFESDRKTIRALVAKGREEAQSSNNISPETLAKFRAAVSALKDKADGTFAQGTRQRGEVDNFLKALYGLSNLLKRPPVEQFLEDLKKYQTTTMGQLITFMHTFNLRFGPSKTPEQEAAYEQLYPILVGLRDGSQAKGPNLMTAKAPQSNPRQATSFFGERDYKEVTPPAPAPAPAPPAPSQPS